MYSLWFIETVTKIYFDSIWKICWLFYLDTTYQIQVLDIIFAFTDMTVVIVSKPQFNKKLKIKNLR